MTNHHQQPAAGSGPADTGEPGGRVCTNCHQVRPSDGYRHPEHRTCARCREHSDASHVRNRQRDRRRATARARAHRELREAHPRQWRRLYERALEELTAGELANPVGDGRAAR